MRELLDGTLQLLHADGKLRWTELPARPAKVKVKKPIVNNKPWKPSAKQQPPRFSKAGQATASNVTLLLRLRT